MSKLLDKLYTEPEICPANPSPVDMLTEDGKNNYWIVQFRYFNLNTGEWEPLQYKKGINYFHKFKERLAAATALRDTIKLQLEQGWNPISNTYPASQAINPLENSISKLSFNDAGAVGAVHVRDDLAKAVEHIHPQVCETGLQSAFRQQYFQCCANCGFHILQFTGNGNKGFAGILWIPLMK